MQEVADLIFNYGVGVMCIAYFIYFQNTTMKELLTTLQKINTRLTKIEDKVGIEEEEE